MSITRYLQSVNPGSPEIYNVIDSCGVVFAAIEHCSPVTHHESQIMLCRNVILSVFGWKVLGKSSYVIPYHFYSSTIKSIRASNPRDR